MATQYDIRSQTPRSNKTRPLSAIKNLVRHHSGGSSGDFQTFMKHWNALGWGTGGYHYIILRDGSYQYCYELTEITNGVGGQNSYTAHICLVGNGQFTEAQERTWHQLATRILRELKLPVTAVKGHREMPGAATACPGIDMNLVRECLVTGKLPRYGGAVAGVAETIDPMDKDYLMSGDVGASVGLFQKDLNKFAGVLKLPPLTVDNSFGPATEAFLKKWQAHFKLSADGLYGPNSQKKMREELAKLTNPPKTMFYKVRRSPYDATTQLGAFVVLDTAKTFANENPGYKVYDDTGKLLYTPPVSQPAVTPAAPRPAEGGKPVEKKLPEAASRSLAGDWQWAYDTKLKDGQRLLDGTNPQGPVTREQLAAGLHRIYRLIQEGQEKG